MRALLIVPEQARVREITLKSDGDATGQLRHLQELVGGPIEIAHRFESGDFVMVDETGKLKNQRYFFWIQGAAGNPFAGVGVVVGKEDHDGDITPALSLAEELEAIIQFSLATKL